MKSRIFNVEMPEENEEYSLKLPEHTSKFTIQLREKGFLQVCWVSDGMTYINIEEGKSHTEEGLRGKNELFFRTNKPNTAEIICQKA